MLTTGFLYNGPAAVRYPRDKGPGVTIEESLEPLPIGRAEIKRRGQKLALLAFGSMVQPAIKIGEHFAATVINMRFVKPLDQDLILQLCTQHEQLITLEENSIQGGAGSGVNEYLAAQQIMIPILNIGLPDRFIEHGSRDETLRDAGLDVPGLIRQIESWQTRHDCKPIQTRIIS
jgi:1-deoxy-D-xylulose-5-phosphate synthase